MIRFLLLFSISFIPLRADTSPANLLLRDLLLNAADYREIDKEITLDRYENKKGYVLFFVRRGCRIAELYSNRFQQLVKEHKDSFAFFTLFSSSDETPEKMAQSPLGKMENVITVRDTLSLLAREADVTISPTIVLLDRNFRQVYKGPIDDQHSIDGSKPEPRNNYLKERLLFLSTDTPTEEMTVRVQGCVMNLFSERLQNPNPKLTYHKDIVPIIEKGQCLSCHRTGEIAGRIALDTYEDVANADITAAQRIASRRMPPWQADPRYGDFHGARRLSNTDIQTFLTWVESGSPQGEGRPYKAEESEKRHMEKKADYTWQMPEPFTVSTDAVIPYQYFLVDSGLTEDTWVKSVTVKPGAPEVVHHMRAFVIPPDMQISDPGFLQRGVAARLKIKGDHLKWAMALWGQNGNAPSETVLGSYTPGLARSFPTDTGVLIPKGSKILFEGHYTSDGIVRMDQSSVSVEVAKEKPKYQILELPLGPKFSIKIPPNESNFTLQKEYRFPRPARIISLRPHMHLRGKSYRVELIRPGQKAETLIYIPFWDYKWQTYYEFRQPIDVERGTKIIATSTWDNSTNNPNIKDPTSEVRFGPDINDEMAMAYLNLAWLD